MGNSNTTQIQYLTKDGIHISYIFWDLKGKNRFPQAPGDSEVNFMLERCLQQINASYEQMKYIKQLNNKYKYRFVILHKRKVAQARKQLQLENLRRSSLQVHHMQQIKMQQQKSKTTDLQQLMKDVQLNETLIKVALMKIDKYIAEKLAHNQFIAIKGLQRLIELLQKAIKINLNGTKTNFSNQIQLLKFFKYFSDRYPKEFYNYVPNIKNYAHTIIKTYHPVNTHITAYCLNLLRGYLWRVVQGDNIIKVLELFRLQENYQSFLSPFAETINETDSIIMVYYNIKFINDLMAAVMQQDKREMLRQNLAYVKYNYILDGIKSKFQQNFFNLDNATFISMHQKIFKYATKDKKIKKQVEENNRVSIRNTLNISAFQQQILLSLLQGDQKLGQQDQAQQNGNQEIIVAYLAQSDRRGFNKFIMDTLTEIQNYSKLEYYLQNTNPDGDNQEQTQQMVQQKIIAQNLQNYIGRIKLSCVKNNCNDLLSNCFKNLSYFQKNQWKHLQRFILQELGLQRKISDQVQQLKANLQEKQSMIKRILKENNDLKRQINQLKTKENTHTQRNVGKITLQSKNLFQVKKQTLNQTFDQSLANKNKPTLPVPPKSKKLQLPQMPASLSKFLPKDSQLPLPPNMKKKQVENKQENEKLVQKIPTIQKPMRDKPKLTFIKEICSIQIKPSLKSAVQKKSQNVTQLNNNQNFILPPPPTLGKISQSTNNSNNGMILPPPPPLSNSILPPPPSLNNTILPPPPTLNNTILPPPPPLNSTILPPPPSLNNTILPPPPPQLGNTTLPTPPTLGSSNLLPPPPLILGGNTVPPPPALLNSLGGAPMVTNLGPPNLLNLFVPNQKIKQKRQPKVPLKACNFTTLAYQKIVGSVFEQIDDLKNSLNEQQLVQLFSKNISQNKPKNNEEEQKTKALQTPKMLKQPVKLLSAERFRNLQIILAKLKIPPGQISKALIQCSGKFTSHSILQSISKILPTQQQQQIIKTYEGLQEDLGKPQRFYKQIIQIPQYAGRVKSLIFSNIKQEFYYQLSTKLQQLRSGFISLKQNKRFKYVIQICLTFGNYLNGTTFKGGAWGFKIQTIQRLEQIKSTDGKTNGAFYLVKQVWKKYPHPIFQKEEIQSYQYLSKMPLTQVNQQIGQLSNYCKALQKAYASHNKHNPNDHIGSFCQQILVQAKTKLEQYKQLSQKLKELYEQCAKYYAQDGKTTPSDQFAKKMFQSVLFVSNTEKMFKVIQEKRLKDQNRKVLKIQIGYTQPQNPQSTKKQDKFISQKLVQPQNDLKKKQPQISKNVQISKLPPPPPPKVVKKQQKLKQIQKIQQQRQKKALQQVMMKRTSKLQAYRMSKMSQMNNNKKTLDQIDFLKGLN